jgi:hypothetical protein
VSTSPRTAPVTPSLYYKILALQGAVGALGALGVYLLGHGQLSPKTGTTVIGYLAAAVAAGIVAYALFRVRPSLPRPEPGQNGEAYLQSPATLGRVAFAWILTGGSGLICWFGLIMTGVWAAAAMGIVILLAFATLRPNALARA